MKKSTYFLEKVQVGLPNNRTRFANIMVAFLFTMLSFGVKAQQPNIAPAATVTASTCNTGPCSAFNDLNFGNCGTQDVWVSTPNPPSTVPGVNWIQWDWPTTESFDEITIHHGSATTRLLTGGLIQTWNGTTWVNHHTFSNLPMQCINTFSFPRATTNRMRITSFQMTGIGQTSNPNFREIEIFRAPTSPNDAGVVAFNSPVNVCPGTHPVNVRVQNLGTNQITSVNVNWSLNGVTQTPVAYTGTLDTVGGTGAFFADIFLDSLPMVANTVYNLVAWTSMPNNVMDTVNFNDTLAYSVQTSLSGTYTINSANPTAGTNFANFTDFSTALSNFGVCGPITANVVTGSGPYNERVVFNNVAGTSATNTVTINGNGETLNFSALLTNERSTLTLSGASHFTVDNLNITATGASFGWVIYMFQANHNTIKNCTLTTDSLSTSLNFSNVVLSGSATSATTANAQCNHNTFENNTLRGGYYGFCANGASSISFDVGNKFIDNVMDNFYIYGIYVRSQDSMEIVGNTITRTNRTPSTLYGIFMTTGMTNTKVTHNRLSDFFNFTPNQTGSSYPIYASSATGTMAGPNLLANNLVMHNNGAGLCYALYFIGAFNDYWNIYHNTVIIEDTINTSASATRAFFITGAQNNMDVRNNIFYVNRGNAPSYGVYLTSTLTNITLNNNAYWFGPSTTNTNVGFFGSNFNTFANWQTANANAYEQNGVFGDPEFLDPSTGDFRPTGSNYGGVGANLVASVPDDINGVIRDTASTPGAFEMIGDDAGIHAILSPNIPNCIENNVFVTLENKGTNALQSTIINWSVNGGLQTPISWAGNVAPVSGISAAVNIGSFNFSVGDTLKIWTSDPNNVQDLNVRNDTAIFVIPPHAISNLPMQSVICNNGTVLLDPQDATGSAYLWSTGDTSITITVNSAGMYSVTISSANGCESIDTVNVVAAPPVMLPDSVRFCEGGAATLETNMQGTYFWSTGQTSSAIQASQSGTYSVTVTDLFGCVSDATTEVVEVFLPIADFSTFILGYGVRFTNLSQNATGYVWNFGDGRITTQESPDHIYDWPGGTFTVTLTVFNECDTVTKTIEVTVNREVGINSMNSQESFNVYPNPNNGQFNLEINSQKSSVFTYTITDLSGKQIVSSNIGVVNGKHVELISLNNVSPGFYFVKVKSENAENVIKISVQ